MRCLHVHRAHTIYDVDETPVMLASIPVLLFCHARNDGIRLWKKSGKVYVFPQSLRPFLAEKCYVELLVLTSYTCTHTRAHADTLAHTHTYTHNSRTKGLCNTSGDADLHSRSLLHLKLDTCFKLWHSNLA